MEAADSSEVIVENCVTKRIMEKWVVKMEGG
jgi:hypothetical protein